MSSVETAIELITKGATRGSTCNQRLVEAPWNFDREAGYGPGSSEADPAPAGTPRQGELPSEYRHASDEELASRIEAARSQLGDELVILGHFYQRDEVVRHADFLGDSFQLAKAAQSRPNARHIMFCGVHFMAETADILSTPEQSVSLPNLAAGCSMADMADLVSVERCWQELSELFGAEPAVPVTYMNSSAALKAFCGRNNGIVCTSSNAQQVLEWAFRQNKRVLFFPDQHLGRNTARAMGIGLDSMPLWDPRKSLGGNSPDSLSNSKVILWRGWCSVHKRFNVSQIEQARSYAPDVRVIVHPECPMEVVDAADESGSTDYIRRAVAQASSGQRFAIGTEINLVRRLANEFPEHEIWCLDSVVCPCSTMYRIHPAYMAWVLDNYMEGRKVNTISVPEAVANDARVALNRMLEVAK
jgi:quinolinate synthase